MKKFTATVFAALIGLALSMPAFSQGNTQPPANTKKTAPASKDDAGKDSKKGKKSSKKKGKKGDTDKTTATPSSAPKK